MLRPRTVVSTPVSRLRWLLLMGSLVGCGWLTLFFQSLTSAVFPWLLAAIFLSSNVYVIVWVFNISASIARAHENGIYDQLGVTPPGALGTNQAMCAAILHRNEALTWINLFRILITGMLLLIFFMFLMIAALYENLFDAFQFLRLALDITVLTTASYLDHIQAIVLGCLVGMLVPTYRRTSIDAPILAAGVFIALQSVILLTSLSAVLLAVPRLYQTLPFTGWLADISPPLLSLLVFYLIRETFNTVVWRILAYRLNVSSAEFEPAAFSSQF